MQVGDLVRFPRGEPQGQALGDTVGIILRIDHPTNIHRSVANGERIHVYWFEDGEASWEPRKWLEVVNERE